MIHGTWTWIIALLALGNMKNDRVLYDRKYDEVAGEC
jgi:hypothetical protein